MGGRVQESELGSRNTRIGAELCKTMSEIQALPAVLLVGGLGTRLRPVVSGKPKSLAPVGDGSFLGLLLRQLKRQGIRRLIMCTGYFGDQVESEFGAGDKWDLRIEYSRESIPMGTAGAIKLAEDYLADASEFLLLNGDSFLQVDLADLVSFHRASGALATLAVVKVENTDRFGTVQFHADGRVTGFIEKTGIERSGWINGGVYVISRMALASFPSGPGSLERDILPRLLESGVYARMQMGLFIDIGVPGDYSRAQEISDRLYEIAEL